MSYIVMAALVAQEWERDRTNSRDLLTAALRAAPSLAKEAFGQVEGRKRKTSWRSSKMEPKG
jgi:hypothetical protein